MTLSTVTPVYAGAEHLRELVQALAGERARWEAAGFPVRLQEAIFVADDPVDASVEVLRELEREHPWVQVVQLARNFGQHAATVAGILQTTGDWVATMDEDLQHHPRFLARMMAAAVTGERDILYANPEKGVHQSIFRDWSSRTYKRLLAGLTGDRNIVLINSFRLLRGGVARSAAAVCSHQTFFDIALFWFSNRVGSLKLPLVDLRYVRGKKSGYNLFKLLSHARKMVVTVQTKSTRVGALAGLVALVVSVIFGVKAAVDKILFPEAIQVEGWTSLFVAGTFLGGIIAFLVGIALEYLSLLVLSAQGKPVFFIVDRSGDEPVRRFFREHPEFADHDGDPA